ncbi:hypothetical protein GCM10010116_54470 [Microbispora rosea subsp. aerata]|nr:hypothetical protein [Microbispora rosea]GGO27140.1 hypothetical protein GCM10010116_54470 [Microbispora rosea subsp. aerata]GIH58544.1 hypothetical protein Mro02_54580 [Microbispora rosea subsp. aerata]GLJ86123.1 hypothetical protein GCM10017588_48560 [Microbispora rosea subsp. aerata]
MNHYLLVYDRRHGRILHAQPYRNTRDALRGRFAAERQHLGNPDIEVVVLGARSWDALKHTHARYFKTVKDLAASALR